MEKLWGGHVEEGGFVDVIVRFGSSQSIKLLENGMQ